LNYPRQNRKKYYTKSVIIALPLGVVKHGGIDILPKLPPRVAKALKYIEAGFYNKVALEFEGEIAWTKSATATSALDKLDTSNLEALTDDHVFSLLPTGAERNKFLRFTNWKAYSGRHVWLGYTTVSYSKQMRTMSDEEILEDALDVFRKSLQRQAEGQNNDKNDGKMVLLPKLKRYRIANWGKDPLSLGSWSYIKVGGKARDIDTLSLGIPRRRLYFAGEYTNAAELGTIHGAFMSGRHAVQKLSYVNSPSPPSEN